MTVNAFKMPVQDRSKARVERILATASVLLVEQSGPVSVRMLAKRAGVSSGTIYQFFKDNAAVTQAVGARAQQLLKAALETHAAGIHQDVRAFFTTLITTIDGLQEAHPEIGCLVRPNSQSIFAQSLASELRQLVATHIGQYAKLAAADHGLSLDHRLTIANATLVASLASAPERENPDRTAYLNHVADLAAAALV
jgi:AcrR family transcriptional regulator